MFNLPDSGYSGLTFDSEHTTMRLLYPASNQPSQLTDALLAVKIARHSPCSTCSSCSGLHPGPGVEVALDEPSLGALDQYGSDDDDDTPTYLNSCRCGHGVSDHGDQTEISREEFARRGRAAVRLDELLQVSPLPLLW